MGAVMGQKKKIVIPPGSAEGKEMNRFFLHHILSARIALDCSTGAHEHDEEVNVYLANLFVSCISAPLFIEPKPYISSYDLDIRRYLERHPGSRTEYRVYKDNADFGLIANGVFLGYHHPGSYHDRVLAGTNDMRRISLYYTMAASALLHCRGAVTLIPVFYEIAGYIEEVVAILRRVAGEYFNFIERFSDATLYHLEKEMNEKAEREKPFEERLDEFLSLYSKYKKSPSALLKKKLCMMAEELKKQNSWFLFDKNKL
jgi:hypothetical protein